MWKIDGTSVMEKSNVKILLARRKLEVDHGLVCVEVDHGLVCMYCYNANNEIHKIVTRDVRLKGNILGTRWRSSGCSGKFVCLGRSLRLR